MNNCKSTGNAFLPSESSFELEVVPRGLCVISGTKTESEIWSQLKSGISIEFFTAMKLAGPQDLTVDGWGWEVEKGKKQRPIVFRNQPLNVLSLMNQLTEVSSESEVYGAVKTPPLFFRNTK
jgi:predicted Zn-dependent protease